MARMLRAPTRAPNSTCPPGLSETAAFVAAYHAHVLATAPLRIGELLRLKKTAAEAAQVFAAERDLTVARIRLGQLSHWCNPQPATASSSLLVQSQHRPAISSRCKFIPDAFQRVMHRETRTRSTWRCRSCERRWPKPRTAASIRCRCAWRCNAYGPTALSAGPCDVLGRRTAG
jgi:hypothetical protein